MNRKEFDELYQLYATNEATLSNETYMQTHDDWNGVFVYDMWRMIQFIKTDPMMQALFDCLDTLKSAQAEVQPKSCAICGADLALASVNISWLTCAVCGTIYDKPPLAPAPGS